MPIIFPKAQEYLKAFYNAKKDFYKIIENDFHPRRHRSYAYNNVKEEHRNEIHESAKGFHLFFGNGHDILDLEVPENFGTPKKALQALVDYRDYLKKDKEEMLTLIRQYRNDPEPPLPIETIIKESQEIIDVLDHVLKFEEITPYMDKQEQLYNIYIGIPWNTECYYGLNKKDIEKLFEAIRQGKEFVRIDGQKIYVNGFNTLLIYNNVFNKVSFDKAQLKDIISKDQKWHQSKPKKEFLGRFGLDVTNEFDVPDPHEENNVQSVKNFPDSTLNSRRIFLSHSSADQSIVTDFVEHVLILGMGVKKSDIFYTSGIGTSIKSGEDFKTRIAKEMQSSKAVIQILSENYKKSEVCLNEMGAAWALKDIVIPFLVPGYNYDTGFIHANSQQIKLLDRNGLMTVYEDHKNELFDTSVRVDVLLDKIDRFVKSLEVK
jgi:hypothetical protein